MSSANKLRCIVPSYQIEGSDFRSILEIAEKGDSSWHYPTHIVKLLTNPLPLFIFDEIFIDQTAFEGTLDLLAKETGSNIVPDLLKEIGSLPQIKLYQAADYIAPKVPDILDAMKRDEKDPKFQWAVSTIQDSIGEYAIPNNYRFELINMNITTILIGALGNAVPYDAAYRSLLYEQKIASVMEKKSGYQSFEDCIHQVRKYHIAQPPLRIDELDDIKEIGKEHKSGKLKALRKKIRDAMSDPEKFGDFINYELACPPRGLSKLSSGEDVFFDSVVTFGAWMGAMTATGGWGIPAMIIYAVFSGKLIKDLREWRERDQYLWYDGLLTILSYVRDHQGEFASVVYKGGKELQ